MLRKLLSTVVVLGLFVGILTAINYSAESRLTPEEKKQSEEAQDRVREAKDKRLKEKKGGAGETETVDVSHVLIRVDKNADEAAWAAAKARIDAARARILGGEDFEKVAREVSEDPSVKQNGGSFPSTERGKMVPEFDQMAFSTPVGEVSEPFRTQFGWHFVKVTAHRGAKQETPATDTSTPPPAADVSAPAAKTDPALAAAAKSEPAVPPEKASMPDVFKVRFETSKGTFIVECHKDWAPLGVQRFYQLVQEGFYDDCRFFRVVKGFVVQFGISGDPSVSEQWRDARLTDDPVKQSNIAGTITFAMGGPNSRTTQVFVNLVDNTNLDGMGFSPFGKIVDGMDVVNAFNGDYGESPTKRQGQIQMAGNAFLSQLFPNLDYIKKASIIQ